MPSINSIDAVTMLRNTIIYSFAPKKEAMVDIHLPVRCSNTLRMPEVTRSGLINLISDDVNRSIL
ncbi:MAG: hypothetical protein U0T81_01925 [Saprospiraceae bacterium]